MKFPTLETEYFIAYVADNTSLGIHRQGYNGIASLIPRRTGNNLFVPTFAGLNYETISLAGLAPYRHSSGSKFEPRCDPMHLEHADGNQVTLIQPETSHAHVSARITFSVEEPHYLHQQIELISHRRFCAKTQKNTLRSLWASYIHMPADRHVYMKLDETTPDTEDWVGVTKENHNVRELLIRPLPNDQELSAEQHLAAMKSQAHLPTGQVSPQTWSSTAPSSISGGPLHFYYGICHNNILFLMMFKQPERFRFAYSPCGGGEQPAWSPAWDYVLHLDDVEIEKRYRWDICLVVKEYSGRSDIWQEVQRYRDLK